MTARLERVLAAGWVLLVPLALWTGFGDPVETPKRLVLAALAATAWGLALMDPVRRTRVADHPLALPLLALAVATMLSAVASGAPRIAWAGEEGSWTGASQQIVVWLGALALAGTAGACGAPRSAVALVAVTLALLGYAVVQALGADPVGWDAGSVNRYWLFATLGNPVHLAAALVAGAFAAGAAFRPGSVAGRVVFAALIAGAFATRQRSVWLALGAGLLMWVAVRPRAAGGHPARRAAGGFVALVVVAVGMVAALAVARRSTDGVRLFGLDRLGSRTHIWAAVGRMWRAAPVLGTGADLVHTGFPRYVTYEFFVADPPVVRGDDVELRLPGSAHAEPLQMAATGGVLGAGLWLWALVTAVRAAGRPAPWLPAAAALLGAQLVNPASAATSALLWWLLVAGAGPRAGRRATTASPPGRSRWIAVAGAVLLAASLVAAWRGAAGQAHRREAGRFAYQGDRVGLAAHLRRWDGTAARWHPRSAQADAARWRSLAGGLDGAAEARARARSLLTIARAGDPGGLFPLCAAADLALAAGRAGDPDALREAEEGLREAIRRAPAVASLHADLAAVLEAAGRRASARAAIGDARRRDPAGVFRPRAAR